MVNKDLEKVKVEFTKREDEYLKSLYVFVKPQEAKKKAQHHFDNELQE